MARRIPFLLSVISTALILFPGPVRSADLPIPEVDRWHSQMVARGATICSRLAQNGGLGDTYYDMTAVMYQIADYTGDPSWTDCALRARGIYRDSYVIPNTGRVPGYWNFPTGLRMDFERTADALSQQAVALLAQNAAYASDFAPLPWSESADRSREVAYAILSYISAEALGLPPRQRRPALVDQAYGHLNQWFVQLAWQGPTPALTQFSPFMVGITAHSLIRDWEQTRDPRLIPSLKNAADWLWGNAWLPGERSMFYDAFNGTGPGHGAPDLNLLIAPMYALLYRVTGEPKYRTQGDALFAGGVELACSGCDGKHFDQNYLWSIDYVTWRSMPNPSLSLSIGTPAAGSTVSGTATVNVSATGSAPLVQLTYYVDDILIAVVAPPGPITGDSARVANGPHTLTVTGVDAAGNVEQAAVSFTVSN